MKNSSANNWHRFERDLRHDWQDWSPAERLAAKTLGISSMLFAAFYFGLSLIAA
jgi:hypothetical protein